MAAPVVTSNDPTPGSISWTPFSMAYLGKSYSFPAGTTTSKYTYWQYNGGLGSGLLFTDDVHVIAALTDDDCVFFLNRTGIGINVQSSSMLAGDLIVPGSILADAIGAHQITAQTMTLTALASLIPNGSFDELDATDPTKAAYWGTVVGDGTYALDNVNVKSPGGYAIQLGQSYGANVTMTNHDFTTSIAGFTATGATISWQNGWSLSGQMKVSLATAATGVISTPSFAVAGGMSYNVVIAMEADSTGATPTSAAAVTLQMQWHAADGSLISSSSLVSQDEGEAYTTTDAFGLLQEVFLAPANATSAVLTVTIPGDPTQATLHYLDYIRITQSSSKQVWSDVVPVTAGEWIRATVWAKATAETTDTRTTLLCFHPSDPAFTPDTAAVTIDPLVSSDPTDTDLQGFNTVWTKYTGTTQIPTGMNYMRFVLGTDPGTGSTGYTCYFDDADIENISSGNIQSSDYVQGQQGWALLDQGQTSQVENLNVIGALGADSLTANTLNVAGQDLANDILTQYSGGLVYSALGDGSGDSGNADNNEKLIYVCSFSPADNRNYLIDFQGQVFLSNPGDRFAARIRYTTDGSSPGPTNGSVFRGSNFQLKDSGTVRTYAIHYGSGISNLKIGINLIRLSGTGTAYFANGTDWGHWPRIAIYDLGNLSIPQTLAQKTYASGGSAQSDPQTTYTKHFYASESRSYDSDGTRRTGDTTNPDMYQGRYSSTHGNTMSCAVFGTDFTSLLSGASNITVKLSFRVKHAYMGSGLNVSVHQHNYGGSNTPSTYKPGSEILTKNGCHEGSTYTVTLPSSFGTALKNGTAKGIGFGKPGSTSHSWYGYMYGAGSGSAPVLTISYTK